MIQGIETSILLRYFFLQFRWKYSNLHLTTIIDGDKMEIITGKQESMTHEANHVNLAQQTHYMRERILLEQSLMEEANDTVFNHGFNG